MNFKTMSLVFSAIILFGVLIFSCSEIDEENPTKVPSRMTDGQDNTGNLKGRNFRVAAWWTTWSEQGVIHNRCLDVVDDSCEYGLQVSRWETNQELEDWTIEIVKDFLDDSLDWDDPWVDASIERGLNVESTYSAFTHEIDTLLTMEAITARENTWLYRLADICFTHNLDSADYGDSLEAFKDDVLDVTWDNGEDLCVTITSVAYYSWEFRLSGFDDYWLQEPESKIDFDWDGFWKDDAKGALGGAVGGAFSGGLIGAVKGAAAGGTAASSVNAVGQLTGWW